MKNLDAVLNDNDITTKKYVDDAISALDVQSSLEFNTPYDATNNKVATMADVSNLVDSAPETLDTLNELAAALGDDANFSTTIVSMIGEKESTSNKVTTIDDASTDTQYPSAKATYNKIQEVLVQLNAIKPGAALGATSIQSHQDISGKQDVIADLSTIRTNATLGSTAIQSATIAGLTLDKTNNSITAAALQTALGVDNLDYLPLSGGTLTGNLTAPGFIGTLTGNASSADKVNHVLNITVGGIYKGSYDGSESKFIDVNAVDLNISSALTFLGITETIPTTAEVTLLDNSTVTAVNGNVVIYKTTGQEYFFDGTSWEALGAAESYSIADHNHGNITNEGYIADAGAGLVVTNGTSQITNGAAFTSGGTRFLKEDGTWNSVITEHQDITGKEDVSNKVTSLSSSSTDTEYPSAKVVYDNIIDKQNKGLSLTNITVSTFTEQETPEYDDFPFIADITVNGITSNDYAIVTFDVADAMSGEYAPVCKTGTGTVRIYKASDLDSGTTLTIPSIVVVKG